MFDDSVRTKVSNWVRRMLYGDPDNAPDRIVLYTMTSLKKAGTELHTIYFPDKGKTSAEEIEGWLNELGQIAYDDCEDLGGTQKYALLPYYGKKQKNRLTFRMAANRSEDEDSFDSEPANKTGLIAQLMRHNEAIMRQAVGSTNVVISQYAKTVATLATQNEALQAKHVEGMVLVEELLSQRHDREIEAKRTDFRIGIQQDMYKDTKTLLPLVVNRLAGQKLLPESVDAKTQAMKNLMESLRPEQIEGVVNTLSPPQRIAFFEFYEMFRQSESKSESEEAQGNGTS